MVVSHTTHLAAGAAGKPVARPLFGAITLLFAGIAVFVSIVAPATAQAAQIVMTDILGRTATLDKPAERIVLGTGRSISVLALIDPDPVSRIVGWRDDFKRDTTSYAAWQKAFPAIDDIPVVGGAAGETLSVETVAALQPDLVVLSLYDAEAPAMARSIEVLGQLGIPVLVVDFFSQPLDNALPSLRLLGQALGVEPKAEDFIAFYEGKLAIIRDRLAGKAFERPGVFMHVHAGGMPCCPTPGRGTFNEMIELAGGRNLALAHVPGLYGDVSLEQLLVDDPEIYIGTGGAHLAARGGLVLGTGIDGTTAKATFARLLATPGIADLTAVREKRAFAVWHMFNDSPVNIVLIEKLAKLFHPDLFPDIDPQGTIDAINRDFLAVPMHGTYWVDP
jgi:iron complex transport system substrate-binding protein